MPWWCAGSWAAGRLFQPQDQLGLGGDPVASGWMKSTAQGKKMTSPSAKQRLGVSTTATMGKMPAWCAQVRLGLGWAGGRLTAGLVTRAPAHLGQGAGLVRRTEKDISPGL